MGLRILMANLTVIIVLRCLDNAGRHTKSPIYFKLVAMTLPDVREDPEDKD
jgi:hypothetical protein